MQDQHRKESPTHLADLSNLEASREYRPAGIAVPMTIAGQAGRHWHHRILYPGGSLALCADMFEEQQGTSRLEHSPDLTQTGHRLTHGAENECRHHAVELCIGEW